MNQERQSAAEDRGDGCNPIRENSRATARLADRLVGGSLANPYGWQIHADVVSFLTDASLTSDIPEFEPFHIHQPGAAPVALSRGLAAAGGRSCDSPRKTFRTSWSPLGWCVAPCG
jgi:hypothetical protein